MKTDARFTIITCAYNTPLITECLLKSYLKYHPGYHRLTLIDNSTNNETRDMLDSYNIEYVKGEKVLGKPPTKDSWWTHHTGLDWAVNKCITPYCLILDTDILFRKNIVKFFEIFHNNSDEYVAMGEHMPKDKPKTVKDGKVVIASDEYILPRIHPCFMLLNVDFFKENKLSFSEPKNIKPENKDEKYDVGSYLYEQIYKLGKQTIRIEKDDKSYIHCEGLSWAEGVNKKIDFYKDVVYNDLSNIDITDKFYKEI